MNILSLAPVLISPGARRMNGFQRGKSSKLVISSHNRLADELTSISLSSCLEKPNENHHFYLQALTIYAWRVRKNKARQPFDKSLVCINASSPNTSTLNFGTRQPTHHKYQQHLFGHVISNTLFIKSIFS